MCGHTGTAIVTHCLFRWTIRTTRICSLMRYTTAEGRSLGSQRFRCGTFYTVSSEPMVRPARSSRRLLILGLTISSSIRTGTSRLRPTFPGLSRLPISSRPWTRNQPTFLLKIWTGFPGNKSLMVLVRSPWLSLWV